MDVTNTATVDAFAALVDRLTTVAWPVPGDGVAGLIDSLGWRLDEKVDESSFVVDPGLGLSSRDPGWIWLTDDEVSSISVSTSDDHAEETVPDSVRDGFADQVGVVTARCGDPISRRTGGSMEAVWELPSQSWVIVSASWSGINLTVTSPAEGRARAESSR